jgi:HK97 family phage portal protein
MKYRLRWPIHKRETPVAGKILAIFGTGRAIWSTRDYATLTEAGYKSVAAVFGSIRLITGGAAGIDWKVEKRTGKGKWERVDDSDLWKLLWRPNPREGKRRFTANALGFKLLAGNSFIWKSAIGSLPPQELWSLRPDRMSIDTGDAKNMIAGYDYTTTGTPRRFKAEEILHLVEFNPTDDFYGLSRLEVAAKKIDIANWSAEWNLKALQKDLRPPGAVVVEGTLTKLQRQQMQDDLKRYQGANEEGTVPIFEGGGKWENLSISPKDMEWLAATKMTTRDICAIYNVWSGLLGDTENTTYANQEEGRKMLFLVAILPEMDEFRDELQTWLVPAFGDNLRLDYDRDKIEAIQEDRAKRYAYLNLADWLSVNQKCAATGYPEIGPAGDVILIPISKIPLELSAEGRPAGGNGGGQGEDDVDLEEKARRRMREILSRTGSLRLALGLPAGPAPAQLTASTSIAGNGRGEGGEGRRSFWISTPERKRALWDGFALRIRAKERVLIPLASSFLKEQAARARDAGRQGLSLEREAELYGRKMAAAELELARTGKAAGLAATRGEIFDLEERKGPPAELNKEQQAAVRKMVLESGTEIAKSTMTKVLELTVAAEAEGWTAEELTQKIWSDLKEFAPWRSRLIARTEMTKLENWGQVEGYKEAEFVEHKGWLSAYAPDTREEHIQADQTYRENTIPLDQPFEVMGELLQYPGDPAGSPGNVCNCLCTTFPEILEIEGGQG